VVGVNIVDSTILTDHLAIHFLELPKLERDLIPEIGTGTGGSRISTTLQRWLYYMHERGEVDAMKDPILLQILKEDPDIIKAERPAVTDYLCRKAGRETRDGARTGARCRPEAK
jgi:hypothetical protein